MKNLSLSKILNIFLACSLLLGLAITFFTGKKDAKKINRESFGAFCSDPWSGSLPIKKEQYVCISITPTTTGSLTIPILEYRFEYYSKNCWSNQVRQCPVVFEGEDNSELSEYVGKPIKIYATVKDIRLKRPEDACDNAYVNVILENVSIDN